MKPKINHTVKILTTGFVVLTLLLISLFWLRFLCQVNLFEMMPDDNKSVSIEPSWLVPYKIEDDPNVVRRSKAFAAIRTLPFRLLGFVDYFVARLPGGHRSNVYFYKSDNNWMYLDEKAKQIVYHYTYRERIADNSTSLKIVYLYIGPEGISEIPDKTLGHFIDPIIDSSSIEKRMEKLNELIIYGKKLRCFFKIDFNQRTVIKGPKLNKDDSHKPIQIGKLSNNTSFLLSLSWEPLYIKPPLEETDMIYYSSKLSDLRPIIPTSFDFDAGPYLLVLDETGRIDLLNKETLEFAGTTGRLPAPRTLFHTDQSATPKDLLDYDVLPLVLTTHFFEDPEMTKITFGNPPSPFDHLPSRVEKKLLGIFAASVSRDGTAMALQVFDAKGKLIRSDVTDYVAYIGRDSRATMPSSWTIFFGVPWTPVYTICRYLTENLHPPILSIASCLTASAFEAGSGHRALFLLPNSFVAMASRDMRGNIAERFIYAQLLMSPSIIIALLLAWRINKNAVVFGLSKNVRLFWIIGTIAFGLTAYITYRLTRPRITLVTCANCGKLRRPDMDRCHHCKSVWHIPELSPPAWRVLENI